MKPFKIILILLLTLSFQVQAARELCGSPKESKEEALASLALLVKSSFSSQSKTIETTDGHESSVRDTTIKQWYSEFKNAQYARYKAQNNYTIACITQKGVYIDMSNPSIDTSNPSIKTKIGSFLTEHGCVLEKEDSEMAVLYLKLNINECKTQQGNSFHSEACIEIELHSNKNGKDDKVFACGHESHVSKEKACQRAMDKSVSEIWNKLKGKINPGDCK